MKKFYLLLIIFPSINCFAQQGNAFRNKCILLRRFLELKHYQPLVWNDSSSVRLYNKWIEVLDEEKLLFTQKDLAVLEPLKYTLDEEMMGKNWSFFNRSLELYKIRIRKIDSLINLYTEKPFDFSKPDSMTWPSPDFAQDEPACAIRWQKYLKLRAAEHVYSALVDSGVAVTQKIPPDIGHFEKSARAKVRTTELKYIRRKIQTFPQFSQKMENAYLNAIAWCYDPHTDYMNTKSKKEFDMVMSAAEYSAGFDLEETNKGDQVIGFLKPGGSAWRSGELHKGDQLIKIKINGVENNIAEINKTELAALLNGNSDAELELTIQTAAGEVRKVKLAKEKINDEEEIVKSYVLHGPQNFGYINLPGFYSREEESEKKDLNYNGCANDVSKEIVKLKKDTIAGLILDLRYNGGGSMWEAMQLAGIFIDIGPVASVKGKDGKVHFLKDPNRGTIYDGPLIVLINGASASASEFVSAVLQDYNRALIVGGTTYGKGTAQEVLPLDTLTVSENNNYEDFVKVTVEKFYRVNGSTTQWKGVTPDIPLPDIYSDVSFKERNNASALLPDNSKPGIYEILPAPPAQVLKTKSAQRVSINPYFNSINTLISWMQDYKKGSVIPLQWNGYISRRKRNLEMFKWLNNEQGEVGVLLNVTNNGFDQLRIGLSTAQSQIIEESRLQKIKKDQILFEAFKILQDWVVK